jgi:hypothetical protein
MMTETNENYKTAAMQHAIYLVREMDLSKLTDSHRAAAKARLTNLLFYAILHEDNITGEQIKKVIEESK